MQAAHAMPEYYPIPNEPFYGNSSRARGYPYAMPTRAGYVTNRSTHGPYSVVERDFGDRKVSYFIPSEYERSYDISNLDGNPVNDEHERYNTPVLVRRRYYRQYDDHDQRYAEEVPSRPVQRQNRTPPRQPRVIKRIYVRPSPTPPPPPTFEYVYEEDYRPSPEQVVEYVVPRPRYNEAPSPVRHTTYREEPSPLPRQSVMARQPPPPPPPPPRPPVQPVRSFRQYDPTPPPPRSPMIRDSPTRVLPPINNRPKQLSLQEVLAQNRARRGTRIPRPRREVDEEEIHDLPTYRKHYVKNGFIVHK